MSPLPHRPGAPIAVFAFLTVAGTFPLVLHPTSLMLDSGGGTDAYVFLWNSWWMKTALWDLHTNPFFTDYIFYPVGTTLTHHSFAPVYALLTLPVQGLLAGSVGLRLANTLLILMSFCLAGYFTHRLVFHLTGHLGGSMLAGIVYTFSNFHYANTVRFHAMAIESLPLFALCLVRLIGSWRNRALFAASCALLYAFYTSLEYTYCALLLALLILLGSAVHSPQDFLAMRAEWKRFRWGLLGAVALVLVISSPFVLAFLASHGEHMLVNPRYSLHFSADALDFVLPSARHPFFGRWVLPQQARLHGGDVGFGLGMSYVGLGLGLLGLIEVWRRRQRRFYAWVAGAAFFGVLSMGPRLHVAGNITDVPLPWAALGHILPFLQHQHMPMRFIVPAQLCFAVLAGWGLSRLQQRAVLHNASWSLLASGIAVLELFSVPFKLTTPVMPDVFVQIGKSADGGSLLEWPPGSGPSLMGEVWHQTAHRKRLIQDVTPVLPRRSAKAASFARGSELKRLLYNLFRSNALASAPPASRDAAVNDDLKIMKSVDLRFIVVDKTRLSPPEVARCRTNINFHAPHQILETQDTLFAIWD